MKNRNRFSNRWIGIARVLLASTTFVVGATTLSAQRYMENLGRGVVAVRASGTSALVSWRLLGLDPSGIGFNLYRGTTKLNGSVLTGGTNFMDTTANLTVANTYSVRPVIGGVEQASGGSFTLKANAADEPIVRIPLVAAPSGYTTKFIWVGDLDGDKEYDYVIDRLAPFDPANNDIGLGNQFLEAYKPNGTRLWRIDMGPNSRNTYNITPGSSTISMGMYDGVTCYDMNNDGKAEVILKISNGVKFPNGTTFTNSDNKRQFLAVLDGLTGNMITNISFPTDFLAANPLGTQLGIGYPDGVNPAVYLWGRNRNADKSFNDVFACYNYSGTTLTQRWKLLVPAGTPDVHASHQMRIADVDGNGTDEMMTGNMCVNANGTFRYKLSGIIHGDRFYVGKLDPSRAGLQGYGIQQNPGPPYTLEYYYDANTGAVLWRHNGVAGDDVGRGLVGDVDASKLGYEVWSFSGLYNGRTNTLTEPNTALRPYPNQMVWWDGDITSELLNDYKLEKWNPANPTATNSAPRLFMLSDYGAVISNHNPMFIGDILGDWRTEIIALNAAHSQLMVFSTDIPTSIRAYTMPHNPAYRTHMTVKGYLQSPLLDYYFGAGMTGTPVPNIKYVGGTTPTNVAPTVALTSPANGATFTTGANITVSATASDSDGTVTQVAFYRGTTLIGTDTTSPYSVTWNAATAGTHSITAVATDDDGATRTSSAASITVGAAAGVTIQGEAAVLAGGVTVDSNNAGFLGTGFLNFPTTGGSAQFNAVQGGTGGSKTIAIRFANGSTTAASRTGRILVNGVAQNITFTSDQNWTNWRTLNVTATFAAGTANTIRIESTGQDLGNIDQITIP